MFDGDELLWGILKKCQKRLSPTFLAGRPKRSPGFSGSQVIAHSGWSPDRVTRLFKRGSAAFSDDLVHEKLLISDAGGATLSRLQTTRRPSPVVRFHRLLTFMPAIQTMPRPVSDVSDQLSGLPFGIDAIFVIHAAQFVDRAKLIRTQLEELKLQFEWVLEYDVPAINDSIREKFFKNPTLLPSQQSCALKHWRVQQMIVERKLRRALVLEDDAILASDFLEIFNRMMREESLIGEPHVTFLGCGGHYYVGSAELKEGQLLYPRNQGKFTDSYIVVFEAAKRRLEWINANGIPLPIDHLFEQIDRELSIQMYWLEPPIVEQGSHNGRFDSEINKIHARWFQAIQFRWKKMWRRRSHR